MSGLCPYCRRSKTKIIKYRTDDYDPNNRRLGDVYLVERKVKFCCPINFFLKLFELCQKRINNLFVFIAKK